MKEFISVAGLPLGISVLLGLTIFGLSRFILAMSSPKEQGPKMRQKPVTFTPPAHIPPKDSGGDVWVTTFV